jgi:hypothetical protein
MLPGAIPHIVITVVAILASCISVFAQTKVYTSTNNHLKALVIPVGAKGYETFESRVEIRSSRGRLMRKQSFASTDHNHGAGVDHAEWSSDGQFFLFNTSSTGGHQPWHVATYFYRLKNNKIYSLDSFVGPIVSDFRLIGRNTLLVNRMSSNKNNEKVPVMIRLGALL